MDWSKAKNILIFIFLSINIFLLVYFFIISQKDNTPKETITNTVKILKSRGITVECIIPRKAADISMVNFKRESLDKVKITGKLLETNKVPSTQIKEGKEISDGNKKLVFEDENTFTYSDDSPASEIDKFHKNKVEKLARELLKDLDLPVSDFHMDLYNVDQAGIATVVLREKYKNLYIYDNFAIFRISKKGVIYLKCRFKEVEDISPLKGKVIPAYQVLIKNFNDENTVITNIDIGFKLYRVKQDSAEYYDNYLCVWRIKTENGTERYFDANYGEEMFN